MGYITTSDTSDDDIHYELKKRRYEKRHIRHHYKKSNKRHAKNYKKSHGKSHKSEWPFSSIVDVKQEVLADKDIADFALLKKSSFWIRRILIIVGAVVAISLVIAATIFYVNVGKGNSMALFQNEQFPTFISVIHGSFRFSLKHSEDYDNPQSIRSIGLSAAVCDMIGFSFRQSMFSDVYKSCFVTKFRPGSVIALFNVSFEGSSTIMHYLSTDTIKDILKKGTDPELLKTRKITIVDPSKIGPMHGHTSHYAEYLLRKDIAINNIDFYMKGKDTKELMLIDHHKVNRKTNVCSWKEKGSYYAVPNTNCREFIFCDEIEDRIYRLQCPNGTIWNNTLKSCKEADNKVCNTEFVDDLSSVVDFDAIYIPKPVDPVLHEIAETEKAAADKSKILLPAKEEESIVNKVKDVDYLEELYSNET